MSAFNKKKPLLDEASQAAIVAAIRTAEARTTGEIRVFMESHCNYVDALDRAKEIFIKLAMAKTERRNAVLIYAALTDHQFAIFGDEEIYKQAGGPSFWAHAAETLQVYLRKGALTEGFSECVRLLGDALAAHFPFDPSVDKNELPDEIVFGQ